MKAIKYKIYVSEVFMEGTIKDSILEMLTRYRAFEITQDIFHNPPDGCWSVTKALRHLSGLKEPSLETRVHFYMSFGGESICIDPLVIIITEKN